MDRLSGQPKIQTQDDAKKNPDWFIDNCGNNVSKSDYTEGFDANGNSGKGFK